MDTLVSIIDLLIMPFGLTILLEFIQKSILGNNLLVFGRLIEFGDIIIALAFMFICGFIDAIIEGDAAQRKLGSITVVICLFIIAFSSSFFYYGTKDGITVRHFLSSEKYTWSKIKEVNLGMVYTRGSGRLKYSLVLWNQKELDINNSLLFSRCDGLRRIHQLLRQYNVPFSQCNFSQQDLDKLGTWEKELIK